MNYQPETGVWVANINQIETTDPVLGGPGGVDNQPLLQLANRTGYLKGIVDSLSTQVGGLAPINSPNFTGTPTVPLAAASDNSGAAASTAFVQRAENGVTTINTTGGTTTLTADQAALPNFVITGTLTSNATINIPTSRVGLMRVVNATSGAYTVTFKTSTGVGRVLRQGVSRLVYGNNVDVVDGEQSAGTLFVESSLGLSGPATLDNAVFLGGKLASGTSTPLFGLTAANDLIVGSTATTHGNTLFQNNGSTLAQLTAAGLFGIGGAPSYKVHAYTAATNTEIRATTGTAGDAVLTLEAQSAGIGAVALRRATGRMAFGVGGVDQMTLTNAATLALGSVNHVAQLNVAGDIYASRTTGPLLRLADQYNEARIMSVPDATVSASHMDLMPSATLAMRLRNNGHVSIGASSDPGVMLGVTAPAGIGALLLNGPSGTTQAAITDGNVNMTLGATLGVTTTAYARLGTTSAHALRFLAGGAEVGGFDTAGDFLIGTNSSGWATAGRTAVEVNGASNSLIGLKVGNTRMGYLYHDGSNLSLVAMTGLVSIGAGNVLARLTVDLNGNVVAAGSLRGAGSSLTLGALGTNSVIAVDGSNNAFVRGTTLSFQNVAGTVNLATIDASGNFVAGGSVTATNGVSASAAGGFASSTYATNVRNPIWRFGNADAFGISYFQGTSGYGGVDSIGFHFGTATSAASSLNVRSTGIVVNGSGVFSAGLYSSQGEGLRIQNDGGYIAFFNTANNTRTGYLQGNTGSDIRLMSETGVVRVGTPNGQLSVNSLGIAYTPDGNEIGYKGMPINTVWANGQCTVITANFTIPQESPGEMHGLCNDGGTSLTLTAGSGLQMFKSGSATAVSSVTLQPRGMASVWYRNTNQVYVSGAVQ